MPKGQRASKIQGQSWKHAERPEAIRNWRSVHATKFVVFRLRLQFSPTEISVFLSQGTGVKKTKKIFQQFKPPPPHTHHICTLYYIRCSLSDSLTESDCLTRRSQT